MDGTNPIVALADLTTGQAVSIAYQNGTVSALAGTFPYVNADGDQQEIKGTTVGTTGTHFPTLYMVASNYPVGQPYPFGEPHSSV
ncbi:MAG: hypothetical protein ABSE51_24170 [Terracidiphilus sp.]|jgi:hypothetical protein